MSAANSIHPQQLRLFMRPEEIIDFTVGSVEAGEKRYDTGTPAGEEYHIHDYLEHEKLPAAKQRRRVRVVRGGNVESEPSREPSRYESVRDEGVKKPIILSNQGPDYSLHDHFWIGNGHHRLASALEAEKETGRQQWIPVIHDKEDFMGGYDTRQHFGVAED